MPSTAEIFSVDTVSIRPAEEAFRSGSLVMPTAPDGVFVPPAPQWADSPVNGIMICLAAISMIFLLSQLVEILPFILGGAVRSKPVSDLEASVRHSRDRNALFYVCVPLLALVSSRYMLYAPAWLESFSFGARTLLTLAVFAGYVLIREILVAAAWNRHISRETYFLSARCFRNFFILSVLLLVITVGVMSIFRANDLSVKYVCLAEAALVHVLFLFRRTQILRNSCNQFTAILYLCALEWLPTFLLVASAAFM